MIDGGRNRLPENFQSRAHDCMTTSARAHSILPRLLLGAARGPPAAPATPVARGLVALVASRSPFDALLAALRAAASGSSSPIASLVPLLPPPPRPPPSRAEFILLFHALALAYPPLSPAAYFLNAGDPPVAAFAPVVLRRCSARLSLPRGASSSSSS